MTERLWNPTLDEDWNEEITRVVHTAMKHKKSIMDYANKHLAWTEDFFGKQFNVVAESPKAEAGCFHVLFIHVGFKKPRR